jgi:succinate dehydrogenase / fumarate reductase cytochrome b subunit
MQSSVIVPILYSIGVLASVFHLANGIWTMGITWGVWITPPAQRRANYICAAIGILLAFAGLGGVVGFSRVDVDEAYAVEQRMYDSKLAAGEIAENEHKRKDPRTTHTSESSQEVSLDGPIGK